MVKIDLIKNCLVSNRLGGFKRKISKYIGAPVTHPTLEYPFRDGA